jgi:hypothetical protein
VGADDGEQLRPHHLERDHPVVPEVAREMHGGHTAGAEFAFDAVSVRQCVAQSLGHTGCKSLRRVSLVKRREGGICEYVPL